jgi:hypothetical protein
MFEDRERSYEAKWAHDEEAQFRLMAERNRLLGLWAAEQLKLSGFEAEEYVKAVAQAGVVGKSQDTALEQVRRDFHARKIDIAEDVLRHRLEEFHNSARINLSA